MVVRLSDGGPVNLYVNSDLGSLRELSMQKAGGFLDFNINKYIKCCFSINVVSLYLMLFLYYLHPPHQC